MKAEEDKEVETWNGPFHRRTIPKGEYGELSKVREELEEGLDALEQGQLLMFSVELADIVGALNGVAEKHFDKKVADIWDDQRVFHINLNKERYIVQAIEDIGVLLEQSKKVSEETLREMLETTVKLATYFNLDFEDLNDFAILRSRVARYAIENS